MQTRSAWTYKNFRVFTYGNLLLPFAMQTQSLLIGWQIYEIKRDPLFLGFIGLAEALPALSLTLLAGYIVDRGRPLKIYRNVVWLNLVTALLLLIAANPWKPFDSEIKVATLYFAAFLAGLARGFRMPTRTALVPQLVPRDALQISSAWSTIAFSVASAIGPAIGGALYTWQGAILPYLVNAIAITIALIFTFQIKLEHVLAKSVKATRSLEELTAGLRYVFSHKLLLPALSLDMFAVLFGGAVAMLPVFAAEVLHVGVGGLGVLRASPSLGALVGGLLMVRFPVQKHAGRLLLGSVVVFGLCMIGFGLSQSFAWSAFFLLVGGAFDSVSMILRGTIVHLTAPAEMRGRVGAVNALFINISNQLGEFESGVAAKILGLVPSVVAGGVVTVFVVCVIAFRSPKLRALEMHKL